MTFLNGVLLFGLFAGAVPLIIHLINRTRYRTVEWGAMHLLEQVLKSRQRRFQIQQLILLLIRTAIPMVLALCMARPVLTGMNSLLGKTKTSVVLSIDDSASMNAAQKNRTQFQDALEKASQIVENLPRGSEVSIHWMASGDIVGPTYDHDRIQAALFEAERGNGMMHPSRALDQAVELLGRSNYPDRELIIISDYQSVSWPADKISEHKALAQRLQEMDPPTRLTLFRVGKPVSENIGVEKINLSRTVIGTGRRVRIRADVHNYGQQTWQDLRVFFRVDGEERSASLIQLRPDQTAQVLFSHAFAEPGSHFIEVFADADPLREDNARMIATPVIEQLPVLLVSSSSGSGPLSDPADFLQLALQPYKSSGDNSEKDLIDIRRVEVGKFSAKDLENGVKVVVLANIKQFNSSQSSILEEFVNNGGGVLFFPGSEMNIEDVNNNLFAGGQGILPYAYEAVPQFSVTGQSILTQRFSHPALEIFNSRGNGDISEALFKTWQGLADSERHAGPGVNIIARFENDTPFLAEKEFGAGRVIAAAAACDLSWSNFPMKSAYLPFMQEMVIYLASKVTPPRNIESGETLAALLPRSAGNRVALITDPAGNRSEVKAVRKQTHALVEFSETQRTGLYILDPPTGDLMHYVVRTPAEESNLNLLEDEEIEALSEGMNASVVTSSVEYQKQDRRRRFGYELWKFLLFVLLVLIAMEMYFEQRFANQA